MGGDPSPTGVRTRCQIRGTRVSPPWVRTLPLPLDPCRGTCRGVSPWNTPCHRSHRLLAKTATALVPGNCRCCFRHRHLLRFVLLVVPGTSRWRVRLPRSLPAVIPKAFQRSTWGLSQRDWSSGSHHHQSVHFNCERRQLSPPSRRRGSKARTQRIRDHSKCLVGSRNVLCSEQGSVVNGSHPQAVFCVRLAQRLASHRSCALPPPKANDTRW